MLGSATPRNLRAELRALEQCFGRSEPRNPRFVYVPGDHPELIGELEAAALDLVKHGDLGAIYVHTRDFAKASEKLQLAFSRDPDDPKTLFYLGLANEMLGREQTALRLFERYPEFSLLNPYRRLMAGRYAFSQRKTVREAMLERVANEKKLAAERVEPRVVAVYPLTYQGADERYAALGRGLAQNATNLKRRGDALERLGSEQLKLKCAANQPTGPRSDGNGVCRRQSLNARRQIGGFADRHLGK